MGIVGNREERPIQHKEVALKALYYMIMIQNWAHGVREASVSALSSLSLQPHSVFTLD